MLQQYDLVVIEAGEPFYEDRNFTGDAVPVNRDGQIACVEHIYQGKLIGIITLENYFPDNKETHQAQLYTTNARVRKIGTVHNLYAAVAFQREKLRVTIDTFPG